MQIPCDKKCKNGKEPPCNKKDKRIGLDIIIKPPVKKEPTKLPKRGPQYSLNLITGAFFVAAVIIIVS
jgi:hypothetical protein